MATGGGEDLDRTLEYWPEMSKELEETNEEGQKRYFTRAQVQAAQVSKEIKKCFNFKMIV